jgi:hypothetical protein
VNTGYSTNKIGSLTLGRAGITDQLIMFSVP